MGASPFTERAHMKTIKIIVGALALLTTAACSSGGGEADAQAACRDEIASQMKLPDTTVLKEVKFQLHEGTYEVTGSVEAENSLGGTVRSKFVCDLSYIESSDSWNMQLAKTYDGETFETLSQME